MQSFYHFREVAKMVKNTDINQDVGILWGKECIYAELLPRT